MSPGKISKHNSNEDKNQQSATIEEVKTEDVEEAEESKRSKSRSITPSHKVH